jgi:serine/threonine protein phosphatase PrpC
MTQRLESTRVLHLQAEDDQAALFGWSAGEIALYSHRSPDKEEATEGGMEGGMEGGNEDGALILPLSDEAMLLAVADGCGGMPSAGEAARIALESLASVCGRDQDRGEGEDLSGRVLAGFDAANRAVMDLRTGAATTLAAVLIAGGSARAFHAGDSLILVTGQRGRMRFCSTAHSPTGYGVEAGLLSEREALAHEERSVVLNVVGTPEMYVEIGHPFRLRPRDTVLLASDGLADNMLIDDIAGRIRTGSCREAVQHLALTVRDRMARHDDGHADDLTIMAYRPVAGKPRRKTRG